MLPELADPNVYVHTCFRIRAPYEWGRGWTCSTEEAIAFDREAVSLLQGVGFTLMRAHNHSSSSMVGRRMEGLYLHPMELSGYIVDGAAPEIEAALAGAKTFKHYHTDAYERVRSYTEDEFAAAMEDQREQIESKLRVGYRTRRRDLWRYRDLSNIKSGVAYLPYPPGTFSSPLKGMEAKFIEEVFADLVSRGEILTTKRGEATLYRTRSPHDPVLH